MRDGQYLYNPGFDDDRAVIEKFVVRMIRVVSNRPRWERLLMTGEGQSLHFVPPAGWAGFIESDP